MMRSKQLGLGLLALLFALSLASIANAEPGFWTSQCASCHSDDTPSCNGCHEHDGNIQASAGSSSYLPGEPVTINLTGGERYGWIRGLLYDESDIEIDRATGPTGTGDDGLGNQVTFPVELNGTAPLVPGNYIWKAAWYGNNDGGGHYEIRRNVTIHVEDDGTGVVMTPVKNSNWAQVKALY